MRYLHVYNQMGMKKSMQSCFFLYPRDFAALDLRRIQMWLIEPDDSFNFDAPTPLCQVAGT